MNTWIGHRCSSKAICIINLYNVSFSSVIFSPCYCSVRLDCNKILFPPRCWQLIEIYSLILYMKFFMPHIREMMVTCWDWRAKYTLQGNVKNQISRYCMPPWYTLMFHFQAIVCIFENADTFNLKSHIRKAIVWKQIQHNWILYLFLHQGINRNKQTVEKASTCSV